VRSHPFFKSFGPLRRWAKVFGEGKPMSTLSVDVEFGGHGGRPEGFIKGETVFNWNCGVFLGVNQEYRRGVLRHTQFEGERVDQSAL